MIKAYYAILLFICLGVKSFYTVGYVAYYELNIDYIIEKYCVNKSKPKFKCNGKCHLSKKITFTGNTNTNSDSKAISNSLIEAFVPVFFQKSNFAIEAVDFATQQKTNYFFIKKRYKVSLSITSPPPQC